MCYSLPCHGSLASPTKHMTRCRIGLLQERIMEHHSLPVNATLQALVARAADFWTLDACGVTRSQTPIPALVHRDAYAPTTPRTRVLLVGGLSGRPADVTLAYNLLAALGADFSNGLTPNGLGPIPGLRLTTPPEALGAQLNRLWSLLPSTATLRPSSARHRLEARRARSPLQVARSLAAVYGHTLEPVVYTQGMALSGRLRLSRLDPTYEDPVPSIVRLVEPYVSGEVQMFDASASTAAL